MSMHNDPLLSQQIWDDEPSAIRKARERYEADPEAQLVPWISTLYSFRSLWNPAQELYVLLNEELPLEDASWNADQLDVLSTVLLWAAREYRDINPEFSKDAIEEADALNSRGIRLTESEP